MWTYASNGVATCRDEYVDGGVQRKCVYTAQVAVVVADDLVVFQVPA